MGTYVDLSWEARRYKLVPAPANLACLHRTDVAQILSHPAVIRFCHLIKLAATCRNEAERVNATITQVPIQLRLFSEAASDLALQALFRRFSKQFCGHDISCGICGMVLAIDESRPVQIRWHCRMRLLRRW